MTSHGLSFSAFWLVTTDHQYNDFTALVAEQSYYKARYISCWGSHTLHPHNMVVWKLNTEDKFLYGILRLIWFQNVITTDIWLDKAK